MRSSRKEAASKPLIAPKLKLLGSEQICFAHVDLIQLLGHQLTIPSQLMVSWRGEVLLDIQ